MTYAVCFYCGEVKFGALVKCKICGKSPKSEVELARSLIMTDHHLDKEMIDEMASMIKAGVEPPIPHVTLAPFLQQAKEFSITPMGQSILGGEVKQKKWFQF